ncbi:MAG: DUF1700 domain-containing protein [Lachnospiraceae bacterium]|nr:DUF1700 domain-containing protein [Lachnospiraceae bacterium]
MEKREFIEKLQRALAGGLGSSLVADNVRYYQDYIESEIRKGRSEQEVLEQLGDPRLLAKSIIEANKRAGASYGSNMEYDEEVRSDSEEDEYTNEFKKRGFILPEWLIVLIAAVVFIVIIGVVTSLLSFFSPVIIIALIIILVVKLFQSNTK